MKLKRVLSPVLEMNNIAALVRGGIGIASLYQTGELGK